MNKHRLTSRPFSKNRQATKTAFLIVLATLTLFLVTTTASAQNFDQLSLLPIATGLSQPVAVVNAGDNSNRLFIVEQHGLIKVFNSASGSVNAIPFLDISAQIDNAGNEQGLLGLAFHPDYSNNGQFFVNYTRDPGAGDDLTVIARFTVSATDPDVADQDSESKLMEIPQDSSNHNGGDLHFGPDGYLYIAMGDGGGRNDQFGHAQDINSLKGKMLRIDVDGAPVIQNTLCGQIRNYGIPDDNPFVSADGCDEIWSYGLRNPWRFSFDRDSGDMYIGDVGQNAWEEIDFEPAATPGVNYGWSCREGAHDFDDGSACVSSYTDPILEFEHGPACSVTGGFVYRGEATAFNGYYFYGDYCSDQVWLAINPGSGWQSSEWTAAAGVLGSISSFGEDEAGELYIADRNGGKVFRISIQEDTVFSDSFEELP